VSPTVSYTLDLEPDYAGVAPRETYDALYDRETIDRLVDWLGEHRIKLTVFATGKLIAERRDRIDLFRSLGAEVELHGYGHAMYGADPLREFRRGLAEYRRCLDKTPLGYRAPGGVIRSELFEALGEEGIRYDSSVIPSFRRGVYSNMDHPTQPHFLPGGTVLELPVGVIPRLRLLISTSYMKLLGMPLYRLFFRLFGRPDPLVYLFHMVDLAPVPIRRELSPFYRTAYAVREGKGLDIFGQSASYLAKKGYEPRYLSELYERIAKEKTGRSDP